jgi:hypothetical protein
MNASVLISELKNRGCSIKMEGSDLDIYPAENLSDELVKQLKNNKVNILRILHHEEELIRTVNLVCDANKIPDHERQYEIQRAIRNPITAMTCWMSLAKQANLLEKGE